MKKNDRVRIITTNSDNYHIVGLTGTIIDVNNKKILIDLDYTSKYGGLIELTEKNLEKIITGSNINTNIKYESILKDISDIQKRNILFDSLDDETKRREIAFDALSLIIENKVCGANSRYWSQNIMSIKTKDTKEFQEILNFNLPVCDVCARGGVMLSRIRLGNKISSNDSSRVDGDGKDIFSEISLDLMEEEYEKSYYKHPYKNNTTQKLANILCNIIVNGDFNAFDKTNYLY